MNTTTYLGQFLEPLTDAFSREVAERIINLRASAEVQDRAALLAQKANAGLLSPEEKAEYHAFIDATDLIAIIQSKARKFLAKSTGSKS